MDIRFVLVATGAKGDGGRTISDFTGMAANRVRAIIRRVDEVARRLGHSRNVSVSLVLYN